MKRILEAMLTGLCLGVAACKLPPGPETFYNDKDTTHVLFKKPRTSIVSPSANAPWTSSPRVTVRVKDSSGSVAKFRYRLDDGGWNGPFGISESPTTDELDDGRHTIYVRGIHTNGETEENPWQELSFNVDAIARPAVLLSPRYKKVQSNTQVELRLRAKGIEKLFAISLDLRFDPSKVKISKNDIRSGDGIGAGATPLLIIDDRNSGRIQMDMVVAGAPQGIPEDKDIAVISVSTLARSSAIVQILSAKCLQIGNAYVGVKETVNATLEIY